MKKIYLTFILGIILLAGSFAIITLPNGDKQLTESEFSNLTDTQIENYLTNNLNFKNFTVEGDKIWITYGSTGMYKELINGTLHYVFFDQTNKYDINLQLWQYCRSKKSLLTCKNYLVDKTTITNINGTIIASTKYRANLQEERNIKNMIKERNKVKERLEVSQWGELTTLLEAFI